MCYKKQSENKLARFKWEVALVAEEVADMQEMRDSNPCTDGNL